MTRPFTFKISDATSTPAVKSPDTFSSAAKKIFPNECPDNVPSENL